MTNTILTAVAIVAFVAMCVINTIVIIGKLYGFGVRLQQPQPVATANRDRDRLAYAYASRIANRDK